LSVLRELCRRTGALLVVDDFGAGHSNLERVVELEPSIVKLDLALTRGIHAHPRKRAVVRHMVNLCKELGARVVAEGIEAIDELSCVRDLGVDWGQGYLLARPAAPPPPCNVAWPFHVDAKLPSRLSARPPVTAPVTAAERPRPPPPRRPIGQKPVKPSKPPRPASLKPAKPSQADKRNSGRSSQKPSKRPLP
jgi:EAL domain-containing protein (putative c-di-GMP-specific phosphodiesterase class I)